MKTGGAARIIGTTVMRLALPSPPCIIDVEASGFGTRSYPIEVGLVLPDGQAYCSLIQPEPDWRHWDPDAEQVHGISRDTLARYGKPPQAVAQDLNARVRGQTVYCDAWYHDYTWLSRLFDAAECAPAFRLEDLRVLLDDHAMSHWTTTREAVLQELALQRHRASNDARVLQLTLLRLQAGQPLTQ